MNHLVPPAQQLRLRENQLFLVLAIVVGVIAGLSAVLFSLEEILGRPGAIFFTPEDVARGGPEQEISGCIDPSNSHDPCEPHDLKDSLLARGTPLRLAFRIALSGQAG